MHLIDVLYFNVLYILLEKSGSDYHLGLSWISTLVVLEFLFIVTTLEVRRVVVRCHYNEKLVLQRCFRKEDLLVEARILRRKYSMA